MCVREGNPPFLSLPDKEAAKIEQWKRQVILQNPHHPSNKPLPEPGSSCYPPLCITCFTCMCAPRHDGNSNDLTFEEPHVTSSFKGGLWLKLPMYQSALFSCESGTESKYLHSDVLRHFRATGASVFITCFYINFLTRVLFIPGFHVSGWKMRLHVRDCHLV